MKRINYILLLLAFITYKSYGQTNDVWVRLKEKFPDEAAVFVERSEVMNIQVTGDSLKVFSDNLEDILYLKEQSELFSGKRVYGSHFNHVENIRAKTLLWEKNRYKEIAVSDIKKNSDRGQGIFYDDSYYYSFNFPAVATRNRTFLEYRENILNPRFITGFIFSSYLPQGKSSFVIKTTKDVELVYDVIHDTRGTVKFKKSEKGSSVTYEWTAYDVPAMKSEENSPSIRYFAPHVICYVKSYQTKKGKVNVLSGLDDLYSYYYSWIKDLNKENSPELIGIVEKLKASSKSEIDLVRKVYYWVQENIQYIAFEQGMRGFIPNSGSYVCEKRYGDCKDMANLIVNMLQIANVKAYHTWIGTRDLPYGYSKVPTPLVDNHMIATYIGKDGTYYFLDGTSNYTPFGYPSSMIQGKEALISFDAKRYEVKPVPVIAKEMNAMTDSMYIKFDNTSLAGKGKSSLTGFQKVFAGYDFDRAEQDDVKKSVTKLIGKGSNKFYLDDYKLINLDNNDKPTRIEYTFRIADYFQKLGDEIYINLNLNKDFYNAFINEEIRKTPIESEYQYVKYEFIELAVPNNYTVEYLPPDSKVEDDLIGCEITYKQLPGKIRYTKKIYSNYLLMNPDKFSAWNNAVKQISEAYKESIIFKRK